MISISKKELKIISLNFRTHANRLINCSWNEYKSYINRFIDFINSTPIISSYIQHCIAISSLELNIEEEVKEVADSFGGVIFDIYETVEDQVAFTYNLLSFFANDANLYLKCSFGYSSSTKYQDQIKGFHDRVIYPFAQDIENYLSEISINMGYDEDVMYSINMQGGQLNVANDNATINANQYNMADTAKLESLISNLIQAIPQKTSQENQDMINENLEVINLELRNPKPHKSLLKTAMANLETYGEKIKDATEFAAALVTLFQFIQPYL